MVVFSFCSESHGMKPFRRHAWPNSILVIVMKGTGLTVGIVLVYFSTAGKDIGLDEKSY